VGGARGPTSTSSSWPPADRVHFSARTIKFALGACRGEIPALGCAHSGGREWARSNDIGARLVALAAAAGAVDHRRRRPPGRTTEATGAEPLSFNQHIRPILSENCWACHGPDGSGRKADLRLDLEDPAKAELPKNKGRFAIVPGKPELSEALLRMETAVEDDVMPPPDSHKVLTPAQKQLFRRWIAEGAKWEQHWAFIPPRKADLPAGAAGPVDFFVQRKLAEAGVAPNGPANPRALLRRLALDLTGLPPTPEESDAFAKDPSPAAYARRGGPAAGLPALRRAHGPLLAGCRALRRHPRLPLRQLPRDLALPRLGGAGV
jgi:mono/diheme cytochrome c family protein